MLKHVVGVTGGGKLGKDVEVMPWVLSNEVFSGGQVGRGVARDAVELDAANGELCWELWCDSAVHVAVFAIASLMCLLLYHDLLVLDIDLSWSSRFNRKCIQQVKGKQKDGDGVQRRWSMESSIEK